ncbi:MAG: TRIC cation channel family protein [Janthinobacterium lividum]
MEVFRTLLLFVILSSVSTAFANKKLMSSPDATSGEDINMDQCLNIIDKHTLIGGWYLWHPYQFNQISSGGYRLTGMDIELVGAIAFKVGVEIKYEQVSWRQHQLDLKSGKRDIAAGATFTEERAESAYFSIPYRFEENSLFVPKDSDKSLKFKNISEFLAQIRLQNFRLGVINGFIYGDAQINAFINDEANKDIIFKYNNDVLSLQSLMREEIDGFIADKIVGAAVILDKLADDKITEIELKIRTPIHLMFSKKTTPIVLVDHFNQEIRKFVEGTEYKKIVKAYLYPVLLMQTIDSSWFYGVGIIGTIAFAISGIAIAARENSTLFATFLLAMLPSVAGGIMRDVMINRDAVSIILNPFYMYYIVIIVLIGFFTIRLLDYYNREAEEDSLIRKIWDNLLVICDALGQAAFIVTGVTVVIMAKIEPILLWGPFFAFLTSNGGGILRDLIRKDRNIICLSEEIDAEISVIWGLIFSIFLDANAHNPNAEHIKYAVILVAIGAFTTRLLVHYSKMPNIKFR